MPQPLVAVQANVWTLLASNTSIVSVTNTTLIPVAIQTVATGSAAPTTSPTNNDLRIWGSMLKDNYSRSTSTAVDIYGFAIGGPTVVNVETP